MYILCKQVDFAGPVINNVEYYIYVHLSITMFVLYYTGRYQKAFQSVSSQLVDTAYFMSDVQNWKYLVMAPKRRDYGKGIRKGRKEDKVWNLFKDGGTIKLHNSAAQSVSKLLLGDDYNDDDVYIVYK